MVKCIKSSMCGVRIVFGAALLLGLLALLGPADKAYADDQGRNVSVLTAQWWQWVLGIPSSQNPLLDETGENAGVNQPYKGNKVFFLCGVFNVSGTAERTITVPEGTAFFFPLVNFVGILDHGRGRDRLNSPTVPELYAIFDELIKEVDSVYVVVDGVDLTALAKRVTSPPFTVRMPDDNVFGLPGGIYAPGVADGIWFYLPPLPKGTHTLLFGGSAFDGAFALDLIYHITVE